MCDDGAIMMNPKTQKGIVVVLVVMIALGMVVSMVIAPAMS